MEEVSNNSEETLGIVCCYFNHRNYLSRFVNFIDFYQKISTYKNVEVVTVESFSNTSRYRIHDYVDNSISIYSDQIYWQKEELLNIGIRELLKRNHTYIAWVDADIEFVNNTWITETINKIKKYKVVHLFKTSYKKLPNTHNHVKALSTLHYFNKNPSDIQQLLHRPGEPGYGYGYHKSVFKKFMLYDKAIVGAGDFLNLVGVLYDGEVREELIHDRFFKGGNPEFFEHYMNWITNNGVKLPKVGVCENSILVNYHGTSEKRSYAGRENILKSTNFNPNLDMKLEESGLSSISNKPLMAFINNYFGSRGEDDFIKDPEANHRYMKKIAMLINKANPSFNTHTNDPIKNIHLLKAMKKPRAEVKRRVTPEIKKPLASMVIIAKLYHEFFSTSRIVKTPTIVVDKSKFLQTNSHPCKHGGEYGEVYLNFIVENYENLPDICVFANETLKNTNRKYAYTLDNISEASRGSGRDTAYSPIGKNQHIVTLDKNLHILGRFRRTPHARDSVDKIVPSKHTFIEWFGLYVNKDSPPISKHTTTTANYKTVTHYKTTNPITGGSLKYNTENSFYVGKNKILQHDKKYYENLLSCVSSVDHPEEEHYLIRSWQFIFK